MARLLPAGLVNPAVQEIPEVRFGRAWEFHFDLYCCDSPGYAHFVTLGGKPRILDSTESVVQWVRSALAVARAKYRAYSTAFGSEFESIIGERGPEVETEVERMIIEALEVDSRIRQVVATATLTASHGVQAQVICRTVDGQEFSLDDLALGGG